MTRVPLAVRVRFWLGLTLFAFGALVLMLLVVGVLTLWIHGA